MVMHNKILKADWTSQPVMLLFTLVFWLLGQTARADSCEVTAYSEDITCDANFVIWSRSVSRNGCLETFSYPPPTSLVFTKIPADCRGGFFTQYRCANETEKAEVFEGSCGNIDTSLRVFTFGPAYTEVCYTPQDPQTPDEDFLCFFPAGFVCLCGQTNLWTTATTAHFTEYTGKSWPSTYAGASFPPGWPALSQLKSMTATVAPNETITTPTLAPTSYASSGATSADDSDALQVKSNIIALGVGIGIGLPSLLVAIISLWMKCRPR